ncbi:MAG: hypothetical protein K2N63_02200, partial [Lachnospiraceae bacterium]|nr:hypothetical protein [Lachnospiraceae bacterium]
SAYWEYHPGMEDDENYSSLSRAYPLETAGELYSYHYDEEKKSLVMTLKALGRSRVYCPFEPKSVTEFGQEGECPIDYRIEKVGENASFVFFKLEQTDVITVHIKG